MTRDELTKHYALSLCRRRLCPRKGNERVCQYCQEEAKDTVAMIWPFIAEYMRPAVMLVSGGSFTPKEGA